MLDSSIGLLLGYGDSKKMKGHNMPVESRISTLNFNNIRNDLKKGTLKLPQFQRGLVWSLKKSADLLDSILKGYPIGSIILWTTAERLDEARDIVGVTPRDPGRGIQVNYIIDGQQRITSLYAILEGKEKKDNKKGSYKDVYVDLAVDPEANDDRKIVILEKEKEKESEEDKRYIRLHDLLANKRSVTDQYSDERQDRITSYGHKISQFSLPAIQLMEADVEVVVEAFTRLNTGGKPLGIFEIMVAKTYVKGKFDLSEKYKELNKKLGDWEVSDFTVLHVVSTLLTKQCSKKVILSLKRDDFINKWDEAVDCIKLTIDFFRKDYGIPDSKFLPYDGLTVPFAYYFYKKRDGKGRKVATPTGDEARYLKDLFWRIAISGRYISAFPSKVAQDVKRVDAILEGKKPSNDGPIDISPKRLKQDGEFRIGSSFTKAILAIYAAKRPKCFRTGRDVTLDNSYLKKVNSKNDHHFFPKKFLKNAGEDNFYINHVLNITMIDDGLNKKIGARAPSDYLSEFKKENLNLKKHLKTHLVDLDKDGVLANDYKAFFNARAKRVSAELKDRIIKD